MAGIHEKGIETCELTLDVGLGTFQPVHCETLEQHVMHGETYEISAGTLAAIAAARLAGGKLLAIGTTPFCALLESAQPARETTTVNPLRPARAAARY